MALSRGGVKDRLAKSTPGRFKLVHPAVSGIWADGFGGRASGVLQSRGDASGKTAAPARFKLVHPGRGGRSYEALRADGGLRKEWPSISTTWARWSSRSMAAEAMSSSRNRGYHSSTARFEVSTMAPRS